jgi:hypothetical protein
LKRTGEERVGEREGQLERGRGKGGKKEGLINLQERTTTAASSILPSPPKTVFFLFNNRTKRGENCTGSRSRFFSITEPDAVQTVQGVAVACEEAVEILGNQ